MDEWIKKMWYIHTMECYSAKKQKMKFCHLQNHGWTWEGIMRNEISQIEKEYCMISLICGMQKIQQNPQKHVNMVLRSTTKPSPGDFSLTLLVQIKQFYFLLSMT